MLEQLYGGQAVVRQRQRYSDALEEFIRYYGPQREVHLYSAPGRVELGGNNLDLQGGKMLAAAVSIDLIAICAPNQDGYIRVKSYGFNRIDVIDLSVLEPQEEERTHSSALIRGCVAAAIRRGGSAAGLDVYTTSDILRGSGLSSSAAFEMTIAQLLNVEFNQGRFTPEQLAQIGQEAENRFFGKASGAMDQLTVAKGGVVLADFSAAPNISCEPLRFVPEKHGYVLCVLDTGESHSEQIDDFDALRGEMAQVAKALQLPSLRGGTGELLRQKAVLVRSSCGDRAFLRAWNFYHEMETVERQRSALVAEDYNAFLALAEHSGHAALQLAQNACAAGETRVQAIPLALALARSALAGQGAVRLQGTGFSGTIQAYVPLQRLEEFTVALEAVFGAGCCQPIRLRETGVMRIL